MVIILIEVRYLTVVDAALQGTPLSLSFSMSPLSRLYQREERQEVVSCDKINKHSEPIDFLPSFPN
jgi:hypothetical protein